MQPHEPEIVDAPEEEMTLKDVGIDKSICSEPNCDEPIVNPISGLCSLHKCRAPGCNNYAWYWRTTGLCVEHSNIGRYPEFNNTRYCIHCGAEAIPGTIECLDHIGKNSAAYSKATTVATKDPSNQANRYSKQRARKNSIMQDLRAGMKLDECAKKHSVTTRTVYNVRRELFKDME